MSAYLLAPALRFAGPCDTLASRVYELATEGPGRNRVVLRFPA